MKIELPISVKIEMSKEFEDSYKKAVTKSVDFIKKNIQNEIPSKSGGVKNTIGYEIDFDTGEARIGWNKNSKDEMVAGVLEYGSGERGKYGGTYYDGRSGGGYYSKFGESPSYTIPIVPTRGKYMKFMGRDGKPVYMREFKGHLPQYILTKGIANSVKFLPIVFYNNMNSNK